MWASLTLIMLFIYIAVTIIGITRVSVKRVIQWLIASRVIYILILITQIVITIRVSDHRFYTAIIADVLAVLLGGLTELNYTNKQQNHLINFNVIGLIIVIIALICITIYNVI
ncbi:DUF1516 family protein [Apilactobacillus kunkeei]|uniref:DUF1516 family protein n=1 Tax=Apilactobacillus kunkeei TaxID=148814 RepID=A0A0P7J3W0_9LACO|nr:DUF1516 family protein [Apilactobacillus kunkeei]KPN82457.1 hypothetical protein RZ78_10660 [Apilactobacillus kunkeei]